MCRKHENLAFKAEKLYYKGVIKTKNLAKLATKLTCSMSEVCMYVCIENAKSVAT